MSFHLYSEHRYKCTYNLCSKLDRDEVMVTTNVAKDIDLFLESQGCGVTLAEIWSHLLMKIGHRVNMLDLRRYLLQQNNIVEIVASNPGSWNKPNPFDGIIVHGSSATSQVVGPSEERIDPVPQDLHSADNGDNDGDNDGDNGNLKKLINKWRVGCYCVCCDLSFTRHTRYQKHCAISKLHSIHSWNYDIRRVSPKTNSNSKNVDIRPCACSFSPDETGYLHLCLRDNCLGPYMLSYCPMVTKSRNIPIISKLETMWDSKE